MPDKDLPYQTKQIFLEADSEFEFSNSHQTIPWPMWISANQVKMNPDKLEYFMKLTCSDDRLLPRQVSMLVLFTK